MEAKYIQKYKDKTIPQLLKLAEKHFNTWIRKRDENNGCISCNNGKVENAGHYFPTTYSVHRFDDDNVNGQCIQCNKWKHGNLSEYKINLIKKIGTIRFQWLEDNRHQKVKWDRWTLIAIIIKYRKLNLQNK